MTNEIRKTSDVTEYFGMREKGQGESKQIKYSGNKITHKVEYIYIQK